MNARTRTLLAIAMSTALVAPVAFAQQAHPKTKDTGNATVQTAKDTRQTIRDADAVDARVTPATTLPTRDQTATDDKEVPPTSQGAAHGAAHSPVVQRDVWQRLDTDGDGRISATEADADTTFDGDFAAMDVDHDGFVSDAEYRDFSKAGAAQGATHAAAHSAVVQRNLWSRLDTDGDGRISAAEADADSTFDGVFDAMDTNNDGYVSDVEYRTHAKADVSQGAVNATSHSSVAQRATWSQLDADGDGRISLAEADADSGIEGNFSNIDSNGDGFISDTEMRANAKANSKP